MTENTKLFTIGFTKKSAERFFELLKENRVKTLLDTRLNNTGQLAGFCKRDDLKYFCRTILSTEYIHWEESAPEEAMLNAYKNKEISWENYAAEYLSMLERRKVDKNLDLIQRKDACLLCSEALPHHCHRSILAEYLNKKSNGGIVVQHLV